LSQAGSACDQQSAGVRFRAGSLLSAET